MLTECPTFKAMKSSTPMNKVKALLMLPWRYIKAQWEQKGWFSSILLESKKKASYRL